MHHVRNAEPKDIPALLRLLVQVNMVHHLGRPDLFKGPATKYTRDQLIAILAEPDTPIFVCVSDADTVQGYAMCALQRTEGDNILTDRKTLYIDDLCVDEALRGQGVGKTLYDHVVRFAQESGCYHVTLNVWTLNPGAQRFYERCGMKPMKIGMEMILPGVPRPDGGAGDCPI